MKTQEIRKVTIAENRNSKDYPFIVHFLAIAADYTTALEIAKKRLGAGTVKKFNNKQFGGGIAFFDNSGILKDTAGKLLGEPVLVELRKL